MTTEQLATIAKATEEQTPLPEGWRRIKLGDCLTLINGRAYSQHEMLNSGTPIIRIQNLNGSNKWYYSNLELPERQYCDNGDLLFAWSATFGAFIWTGQKAIFHYHIWRVVPHDNLDKDFAFFLLQEITESIKNASHGLAMLHMTKGGMENWVVNLPPINEQRRIATVLDEQMKAVEQARRAVEEQLKATKLLPNAFLRSVFESEEAQNWQKRKLGELCEAYTGNRDPRKKPESSFRYVDISSVDNVDKRITHSRRVLGKEAPSRARQVIFTNDVVVATTRPNLNAVALVPDSLNDEICSTGFCVLRSSGLINSSYLFAFVQSPSFVDSLSDLVKGALYPAVTDKQVKQQMIPLPPIEKQIELSRKLNHQMQEVENLKETLTKQLEAIKKMPSALLRKAFAGEV